MLIIMMWLYVIFYANCVLWDDCVLLMVINVDVEYDADSLLNMTCWLCGCKYLIMQMEGIGECIIWWWKLYNIVWWYVHCWVFAWSSCIHNHVEFYEECKWRCTFTLLWWNNVSEVYFTLGVSSYGKNISEIQLVPHACRSV
jgi:hypothetical protein